ncbi:hypothetical protein CV_1056 [Chromobacterium violaceum ATCC 12472]|uniref:Uncharacterized protein n=1 Tax=Chromobacterium violaceum (strain ATCC 12472 / DSM 30191 / JCM 1249 / CCUG 213 / NBRC 12614 / NCIMB 9131 / NCTC 9757 / MK) TaxID=243365 RepID=Q7NZ66_CHRVO|nr:hypothetical protein CV_1056 [Chromobacterium violaceum ATCC 12472]
MRWLGGQGSGYGQGRAVAGKRRRSRNGNFLHKHLHVWPSEQRIAHNECHEDINKNQKVTYS